MIPDDLLEARGGDGRTITRGDNHPPTPVPPGVEMVPYLDFHARVRDFADAAGAWLDLKSLADEEQAGKCKDFIDGTRKLVAEIDAQRRAEKAPHLAAGKAVDDAFGALLRPLEKAIERTKALQTDYLRREKARLDAERAEAARIAREQADAAEAARRAAEERNDVIGIAEAEEAAKAAEQAEVAAAREARARVTSATGGGRATGLKTRRVATIVNINVAFMQVRGEPAVVAAIQAALNAIVRTKEFGAAPYAIPGVSISEESYS